MKSAPRPTAHGQVSAAPLFSFLIVSFLTKKFNCFSKTDRIGRVRRGEQKLLQRWIDLRHTSGKCTFPSPTAKLSLPLALRLSINEAGDGSNVSSRIIVLFLFFCLLDLLWETARWSWGNSKQKSSVCPQLEQFLPCGQRQSTPCFVTHHCKLTFSQAVC